MPHDASPQILRGAPYFPVADVASASAYYADVLGFRCEYSAGEPPEFAIHSRDGSAVMLRRTASPELIAPNERQGGTWDVFYWVRDVNAVYDDLARRGAAVVRSHRAAVRHEGVRRARSQRLRARLRPGVARRRRRRRLTTVTSSRRS